METDNRKSTSRTKPVLNGKAIYTPKGAALEYAPVGCNLYTGCPHDCEYCYLKRGVLSHAMGGTEVRLKSCFKNDDDAVMTFVREIDKHLDYLRQVGVFFSFSTDPLIKETRDVTKCCIIQANNRHIPVKLLTKNADFIDDDVFMSWLLLHDFRKDLVAFGFTLTGRDDMEPNASTNSQRIETMRRLSQMGFKTFASIEPVIDWTHANMVVKLSLDCCCHYKIGLRSGVKKDYYDLLRSGMWLDNMTKDIIQAGRTVYLKESSRKLLARCYKPEYLKTILSRSVDMDYNLFNNK